MIRLLIVLGLLWVVGFGAGSLSTAAEKSDGPADAPAAETPEKPEKQPGPIERAIRRLEVRMVGATPEERARLDEERKRLQAAAATFGTDPTAIIGYYQLVYGHTAFMKNLNLDQATATVRLPITPNWVLMVNMPYSWADLNQPGGFTTNGTSDMTIRTGGRIFANEDVAFFVGTDASFPTASEKQLGLGKYTLGPGGAMAVPLPRVRSLFFLLATDNNSIGGDPSRAKVHFTNVQSFINTIWSKNLWTLAGMNWDLNWEQQRRTSMELQGQVGYRFDNHWNVFAGPTVGVMGRNTILGLDWGVQAGVRWVFRTPLIPERVFESLPKK